jgi:multisubunit Na+/H+ antiporter MnhB subunit
MTPLTRMVSRATLMFALLISMTHLAGAEEGPGDGFTAGIISSLGLTLVYLTHGYEEAHRRLRWAHYEYVLALGLAVVVGAAMVPVLMGGPVLAMGSVELDLGALGTVRLSRALLFDVGIYCVVFGGTMAAIDSLERETA